MVCRYCRTDNSDGRETCVVCGQPLLDLAGIMERDRWVRRGVVWCTIGLFVGGALGFLAGAIWGGWFLGRESGLGPAIGFGYGGGWIGAPAGAVIGFVAGLLSGRHR